MVKEKDLFEALGCDRTATTLDIKTCYRKMALRYHPDKQVGKSQEEIKEAAAKFKEITEYYQVLIDPKRRERYERTGEVGESLLDDFDGDASSWKEWFDALYTKITPSQIEEFEKVYRYGQDERQDVFMAYTKTKGSLLDMIDHVPYSTVSDIERFKIMIEASIESGELEHFKSFPNINKAKLKKKIKEEEEEAKQAEAQKKDKDAEEQNLSALIQSKNKARAESLLKSLEEKALKSQTKGKKRKVVEHKEPTEEEFAALQNKLFKNDEQKDAEPKPSTSTRTRSKKKIGF